MQSGVAEERQLMEGKWKAESDEEKKEGDIPFFICNVSALKRSVARYLSL